MPIQVRRDDTRRLVRVTTIQPVAMRDHARMLQDIARSGAWSYDWFHDVRQSAASLLTADQLRPLVELIERMVATHGPRGGGALLVQTDAQYGMARMFAVLVENVLGDVAIFRDPGEADRWLESLRPAGKS